MERCAENEGERDLPREKERSVLRNLNENPETTPFTAGDVLGDTTMMRERARPSLPGVRFKISYRAGPRKSRFSSLFACRGTYFKPKF